MIAENRPYLPSRELLPVSRIVAVLGGAALLAGLALSAPRAWSNVLLAGLYLLGLGLAALAFVAIQYASGGTWATVLRRVPEALAGLIPCGGLLIVLAAACGGGELYPWMSESAPGGFRGIWLQPGFFFVRALIYLGLWTVFGAAILITSRRQDDTGSPALTHRNARLSAIFLPVFGVTVWLSSVDWIQSLEPHWSSTIFGVYGFAGLFLSGLAAITILTIRLRAAGPLAGLVTREHLHDLGKLLFAFSTFWMYIWFSQFMLIWYGNLPEEGTYYVHRLTGAWAPLFWANVLLNWAIPFLVLLSEKAKRSEKVLLRVAGVILVGRWLDLYLLIAPSVDGATPSFGIWEAGAILGMAGLFVLVFNRMLHSAPMVPAGDPYLEESRHHHG
jgi:hypothetical protein